MKSILKDVLSPCNILTCFWYQEENLILKRLRSIQSLADGTSWGKKVNVNDRKNVLVGGQDNKTSVLSQGEKLGRVTEKN